MFIRKILFVLYFTLTFLIGFAIGQAWDSAFQGGVTGRIVDTPSNFVDESRINVYDDKIVIDVQGAMVSTYESTGSMLPTLGEGVNGVSVAPKSPDEIRVGDIISFRRGEDLIVHRVITKGTDEQGVYFVTKGDNVVVDDGKVRFEEIERVLIAIVY